MVFNRRKRDAEALESLAERRRREDAAPRLRDQVPTLLSLRMHLEDRRANGATAMPYTRHVVVATGPALFTVRCSEPRCTGNHELTDVLLRALRQTMPRYEGESTCQGDVGDIPCDRTLVYVYEAEFRA